jgi:hypothetical protein
MSSSFRTQYYSRHDGTHDSIAGSTAGSAEPCFCYLQHSAAYTAILVNNDKQQSQLQSFESYLPPGQKPALNIQRGDTQVSPTTGGTALGVGAGGRAGGGGGGGEGGHSPCNAPPPPPPARARSSAALTEAPSVLGVLPVSQAGCGDSIN